MSPIRWIVLALSLNASLALGEGYTCQMTLPNINEPAIGRGDTRGLARVDASEKCVILNEKELNRQGISLNEKEYMDLIDTCLEKRCD